MNETIIQNSLKYLDKNNDRNKKLFKNVKYIKFSDNNVDIEHSKISMLDKDNNVILTSKYEIIGFYTPEYKMWNWAWSIPWLSKNKTYISRKILNYAFDLTTNINLKTELTTSRFRINNPIQLDIYSAIPSYLSKTPIIYKLIRNEDNFYKQKFEVIQEKDIDKYTDIQIHYLFILQ